MDSTRRRVLALVASGLTAGCLSGERGDEPTPTSPTESGGRSTTPPTTEGTTPSPGECDPEDVRRPRVDEDATHPPKGYGTKPRTLTAQSVADYLADFETAYAWNRILSERGPIASLGVDTTTPWTPESDGDGFLAASRIETSYAEDANDSPTTRAYVASYYAAPGPVYRVETPSEAVDPRTRPDRQLVQCGEDTKA